MRALMLAEPLTESDEALALRARRGDRAAFAELVERRYDFVHRLAWRWCGSRADAEDLAQDVCVRLGRAIAGYRGDGAFSTWLYTLAFNAFRDSSRGAARRQRHIAAYTQELAIREKPAGEDAAERLWRAVRRLPDKQRQAVMLVHAEGLSHGGAGEVMGCAEATVSWHIHEAKKRLKVLLTQDEDG